MSGSDTTPAHSRYAATVESGLSRNLALLALRVTLGFLMIWWGLAKGLNTGVGQVVSDSFYGGMFSMQALLVGFGWLQVVGGAAIVLGLFRAILLPVQFAINFFTAGAVWWAIVDPFWIYLPGEKPFPFPQLFYPSAIIVAGSWLVIAFRSQDRWALDARR